MLDIIRIDPSQRMSQAVVHRGLIYTSALAVPGDTDITLQTEQVLEKIEHLLAIAGSDKSRLLQAMVWLADIQDYHRLNAVWDAWLPNGCAPVRACAETKFALPGILVEISVTAALPAAQSIMP